MSKWVDADPLTVSIGGKVDHASKLPGCLRRKSDGNHWVKKRDTPSHLVDELEERSCNQAWWRSVGDTNANSVVKKFWTRGITPVVTNIARHWNRDSGVRCPVPLACHFARRLGAQVARRLNRLHHATNI
jgi:hypothetical protein